MFLLPFRTVASKTGGRMPTALVPCAILQDNGVQFVVVSRLAKTMKLLLYNKVSDLEPAEVIQFNREENRWGHVWSLFV